MNYAATANAEIPTVDISDIVSGMPAAQGRAAGALRDALENIGFFLLVGHGVDWSKVEDAYAHAKHFFDLPTERKMEIKVGSGGADSAGLIGGYVCYRGIPASTPTTVDMRDKNGVESLSFDDERKGRNQWPRRLPGFRESILAYHAELARLASRLLPLYAAALGLPEQYFEAFFEQSTGGLRLSHYPAAQSDDEAHDLWGFLPHTDRSFMTILPANKVPGLEIQPEGTPWISAPFVPKSFIVNSGDLLRRWTNDRFLSTLHRVTKPREERYAMPFFFSPGPDVVLEPLPTCVTAERPSRYEPISVHEFRTQFFKRDYQYDDPRLSV